MFSTSSLVFLPIYREAHKLSGLSFNSRRPSNLSLEPHVFIFGSPGINLQVLIAIQEDNNAILKYLQISHTIIF